jgi:uncharacterized Zn-binding protein involved in type VI secretion
VDRLVGKGDRTTTGGYVCGASSMFLDNDRPMSRKGDIATCGTCEGMFPIFGTCSTWLDEGRPMVKDRDPVLCPCGKNRVLAVSSTTSFCGNGTDKADTQSPRAAPSQSSLIYTFNEQVLASVPGASCEGYPYLIETDDGQFSSGRLDGNQRLPRVHTEGPENFVIYWGDEALDRQDTARECRTNQR